MQTPHRVWDFCFTDVSCSGHKENKRRIQWHAAYTGWIDWAMFVCVYLQRKVPEFDSMFSNLPHHPRFTLRLHAADPVPAFINRRWRGHAEQRRETLQTLAGYTHTHTIPAPESWKERYTPTHDVPVSFERHASGYQKVSNLYRHSAVCYHDNK